MYILLGFFFNVIRMDYCILSSIFNTLLILPLVILLFALWEIFLNFGGGECVKYFKWL